MLCKEDGRRLVKLLLNIMDSSLRYAAPGRDAETADHIAEEVKRRGGLLMINWHQRFCNRETDMYDWVEKTIQRARQDQVFIAKPLQIAESWMSQSVGIMNRFHIGVLSFR